MIVFEISEPTVQAVEGSSSYLEGQEVLMTEASRRYSPSTSFNTPSA